jgi:SNF2 family DNA or RNA helicase
MQETQSSSYVPRAYQAEAIKLCISQACAGLLMAPGLGKTSVIYSVVSILLSKKMIKRTLVICPLRPAYRVWPHQKDRFEQFKHLRVSLLHGKDKEKRLHEDSDICVINPEGLAWLFGAKKVGNKMVLDPGRVQWIKSMFDVLVVDESTKFKDAQSNRFKLLKAFVPHFKRRYILTGTPTPNGLLDLFGQVYILDEGAALGRFITHYRTAFFYPHGFGGYEWLPQADAENRIFEKIAPLVYRVSAKGNLDLPALLVDDIFVDLPPAARVIYDRMDSSMMAEVAAGNVVAANAAVASSKCRQVANGNIFDEHGDAHFVHAAKLDALADLLEQLQGEPCLITYEFVPDAAAIMQGLKIPSISTGNAKNDDMMIQRFSRGELPAVVGQPQSIALGIDGLQDNCCHIAMYGLTWRLQDYLQVIDRVRRSGSKAKAVIVHRILARDTVDERVLQVLARKDAKQEDFMALLERSRQ